MTDKIAVVIVNYNGMEDTAACIESIKKSDGTAELKIILVDNASTENEALKIQKLYPDIITIRNEENCGFSAGNNIGIKAALEDGCKFIMLLNNDTVISPDMIELLRKECTTNTVVIPKMLYYSKPETIWYDGGEINRWTGNAKNSNMGKLDDRSNSIRYCTFATGCCMMINAAVFHNVGLLDEDYFMYCEDTDFCIRLSQASVQIKYVPAAKLWHKVSSSTGGSDSPFCIYYLTRNRLNYVKKYKEQFHMTAYPFTLMSRYIRMLQCKDEAKRKAYGDAIRDAKKGKIGRTKGY